MKRPITLADALASAAQEEWTGFVVLKSAERRSARNGTSFYRTTFADASTAVAANIFEDRPAFRPLATQEWKIGDHFKAAGRVTSHPQYGRQIEISKIRPVEPRDAEEGYSPDALMETAPVDLEAFWAELQAAVAALGPEPLRATVAGIFAEHGDAFRKSAAAKQAHHAYRGGLLQHTVMMLREASALMSLPDFPPLNRSLVVAGILLHDLGKISELEPYPRTEYTEEGNLLGHIQIVLQWLDAHARAAGLTGPLLTHIKHIVLSHHGEHEFGASILPQTPEALLVHIIDNLDAKMNMVSNAIAKMPENSTTTEKLWALDNRTFRPPPAS
ncbi:MAG TPA: HD domain-containing protein [Verrucomicrobiae bacterium]|nr:HD domain-containing protein [Verrucomicrobiae bacterium]